jgi:hypothetical protein
VPDAVVTWGAVAVCAANAVVYIVRFRRRASSRAAHRQASANAREE